MAVNGGEVWDDLQKPPMLSPGSPELFLVQDGNIVVHALRTSIEHQAKQFISDSTRAERVVDITTKLNGSLDDINSDPTAG